MKNANQGKSVDRGSAPTLHGPPAHDERRNAPGMTRFTAFCALCAGWKPVPDWCAAPVRCMLGCLALLMLFGSGCDRSPSIVPGSAEGSKPAITLQLNWKPEPQFGGFYAADVIGAYAKHGLQVAVREGGAGVPTVDMLAAGTVPFAVVSGDELIVARARGKKLVGLYAAYQTHPQGIMTRASRGFASLGDVFKSPGTLAMEQGLPYSDFLKNKYGFGSLKIVPSPFGDLSVYRTDETYSMQCFVTSEPLAARRIGVEPRTFLIAESGYNPYATLLATTEAFLKSDPGSCKAMVLAVDEGWEAYMKDPAATNAAMGKLNPTMDAATFAESAAAQTSLIDTEETRTIGRGGMTDRRWETLGQQLVELKVIEQAPTPAECYVDPRRWAGGK